MFNNEDANGKMNIPGNIQMQKKSPQNESAGKIYMNPFSCDVR